MATIGEAGIEAYELTKSFGEVKALQGISLSAPAGSVLGVLGPNGAGKTTSVRILTTLMAPDSGTAKVAGLDVVADANELRSKIGLAGQYAAVDEYLTGAENLTMIGRLYRLSKSEAKSRAKELLEEFALTNASDRVVSTYSGGMRRRLDLAAALIVRPPVLFLDEPTTGLDPRSRLSLWETIEARVADGTTVLLTTQYLDEADRLADRIAVIDHGKVIAEGTSDQLKSKVGGERLEVSLIDAANREATLSALAEMRDGDDSAVIGENTKLSIPLREGSGGAVTAVRKLDAAQIEISDIALRKPTLDDVFLSLTGRAAEPTQTEQEEAS